MSDLSLAYFLLAKLYISEICSCRHFLINRNIIEPKYKEIYRTIRILGIGSSHPSGPKARVRTRIQRPAILAVVNEYANETLV